MLLTPMRYKDYTWPHNPETYSVEYRRQVVVHKVPFGQYVLQDVGETCRIFQGEGTFAGPDAYEQFQALSEVFAQEGAGLLVHPIWRTTSAYFISLKLEEKPLPDYVHYSFAFWEDCGSYSTGLVTVAAPAQSETSSAAAAPQARTYIVKKGDTLWGIAKRYGVTLSALIAANPQIKNPNLIYPGNEVRIP